MPGHCKNLPIMTEGTAGRRRRLKDLEGFAFLFRVDVPLHFFLFFVCHFFPPEIILFLYMFLGML
jgi:hypothetical protein